MIKKRHVFLVAMTFCASSMQANISRFAEYDTYTIRDEFLSMLKNKSLPYAQAAEYPHNKPLQSFMHTLPFYKYIKNEFGAEVFSDPSFIQFLAAQQQNMVAIRKYFPLTRETSPELFKRVDALVKHFNTEKAVVFCHWDFPSLYNVLMHDKCIYIGIGKHVIDSCSDAELFGLLNHEFFHYLNRDSTEQGEASVKVMEWKKYTKLAIRGALLSPFLYMLISHFWSIRKTLSLPSPKTFLGASLVSLITSSLYLMFGKIKAGEWAGKTEKDLAVFSRECELRANNMTVGVGHKGLLKHLKCVEKFDREFVEVEMDRVALDYALKFRSSLPVNMIEFAFDYFRAVVVNYVNGKKDPLSSRYPAEDERKSLEEAISQWEKKNDKIASSVLTEN